MIQELIKAFLIGGALCAVGQLFIDYTKLTVRAACRSCRRRSNCAAHGLRTPLGGGSAESC